MKSNIERLRTSSDDANVVSRRKKALSEFKTFAAIQLLDASCALLSLVPF